MKLNIFIKLKRKISAREFCTIFNSSDLGRKKYNKLLKKAGVETSGNAVIRPPFIMDKGSITLGDNVFINSGCIFLDNAHIEIGDRTLIGPGVKLCTTTHDIRPEKRHSGNIDTPIRIGRNCWIGAGAIILPGVNIGDNSVIAANSVVTQDVESNALYAGAPAKFKKKIQPEEAVSI
ncbi:sugar O-acetyltransferase [Pseudomonas panipatensis]|uniref:sugar O-acetyltransferase n=1 Tax=Pseudomonas panipatensis TaxID=428992 RepID=UPI0035AE0C63